MEDRWKNPNDIMKVRRVSRRLSRSQSLNHSRQTSQSLPKENLPSPIDAEIDSLKRRNPFDCQLPEAKQKHLKRGHSLDTAEVETKTKKLVSTDFFKEDHHSNVQQVDKDVVGKSLKSTPKLKESNEATDEMVSQTTVLNDLDSADGSKVVSHPKPVMDWSLKTKMRVVITTRQKMKTNFRNIPGIDAKHLNAFVKGRYECAEWDSLDVIHKIRRCSFHYSYPNMPWMSTFPRQKSYFKSRSSFLDTSNSTVLESLQKDWCRVFTSVYQQLKAGACPYFYINTHQFTVLFRCLRSSSKCFLTALLSPSTRGFRELLKKEGISFQMPNVKAGPNTVDGKNEKTKLDHPEPSDRAQPGQGDVETDQQRGSGRGYESNDEDLFDDNGDGGGGGGDEGKASPSCDDNKHQDDEDDDDDDADDDNHLASDWLEDMGLDKKDFPSLRPHNVKLQQENFRDIDNRIQSLVSMDGLDVHAFFNFLLNYPGCIASSGPQYGIPPTILSPLPFLGGSLVENSVKQSVIGDNSPSSSQLPSSWKPNNSGDSGGLSKSTHSSSRHVIEIAGPILPHHSLNIASLVQTLTSFSRLSYCPHPPTTAFNTNEDHHHHPPSQSSLNILTTGLSKLLVPYSPDDLGLIPHVQDVLLSDGTASIKEASVVNHQFIID